MERDPLPVEAEHLWHFFLELHTTREHTEHGPRRLAFAEIHAWSLLTACQLTPMEVEWLRALDDAYLDHERLKAMPTTAANAPAVAALTQDEDGAEDDDDEDDGDSSPA